ncbi:MAG: hypothetical protein ABFQ62_05355 [Patescibacteria group bacterium]
MPLIIQIAIISIYSGIAYLFVEPLNNWLLFVLGLIMGFLFLFFDKKIAYKYYQNNGLVTRSVIFLFTYIPLSLFVITSSGSPLGVGMMISMGFTYVIELWQVKSSSELFAHKFLWQTGKAWSEKEIKIFTRVFIVIVFLLALLALT